MDDPGYALLALVFLVWLFSLLIRLVLLIIRVVLWLVTWTMHDASALAQPRRRSDPGGADRAAS